MKLTFENGESIEIKRKFDGSGQLAITIGTETITPNWLEAAVIVAAIKELVEVYS